MDESAFEGWGFLKIRIEKLEIPKKYRPGRRGGHIETLGIQTWDSKALYTSYIFFFQKSSVPNNPALFLRKWN